MVGYRQGQGSITTGDNATEEGDAMMTDTAEGGGLADKEVILLVKETLPLHLYGQI